MFNFVKNGQFDEIWSNLTLCKAKGRICLHIDFHKPSKNRIKQLNACRGQKERHF